MKARGATRFRPPRGAVRVDATTDDRIRGEAPVRSSRICFRIRPPGATFSSGAADSVSHRLLACSSEHPMRASWRIARPLASSGASPPSVPARAPGRPGERRLSLPVGASVDCRRGRPGGARPHRSSRVSQLHSWPSESLWAIAGQAIDRGIAKFGLVQMCAQILGARTAHAFPRRFSFSTRAGRVSRVVEQVRSVREVARDCEHAAVVVCAERESKLVVDVGDVLHDGFLGDDEAACDRGVASTFGDQR